MFSIMKNSSLKNIFLDASKGKFKQQDEKLKANGKSKEHFGSLGRKKDGKRPLTEWSGSLKRSHRIVIINNEQALVCNESCLI